MAPITPCRWVRPSPEQMSPELSLMPLSTSPLWDEGCWTHPVGTSNCPVGTSNCCQTRPEGPCRMTDLTRKGAGRCVAPGGCVCGGKLTLASQIWSALKKTQPPKNDHQNSKEKEHGWSGQGTGSGEEMNNNSKNLNKKKHKCNEKKRKIKHKWTEAKKLIKRKIRKIEKLKKTENSKSANKLQKMILQKYFQNGEKMQKNELPSADLSFHPKTGASIFNHFSHQKFGHPWLAPARSSDPRKEKARSTPLNFCHLRLVLARGPNTAKDKSLPFHNKKVDPPPKNSVISVGVLFRVKNQRQD